MLNLLCFLRKNCSKIFNHELLQHQFSALGMYLLPRFSSWSHKILKECSQVSGESNYYLYLDMLAPKNLAGPNIEKKTIFGPGRHIVGKKMRFLIKFLENQKHDTYFYSSYIVCCSLKIQGFCDKNCRRRYISNISNLDH